MNKLEKIKELIKSPVSDGVSMQIEELRKNQVIIYGAGSYGKEFYFFLKENGIKAECFLDRNAEQIKEIDGVKVFSLDNYKGPIDGVKVFIAIVCDKNVRKSIINSIHAAGFGNVTEAQSISCRKVSFSYNYNCKNAFERIEKAYNLLSDDKSREIFLENIYAHLSRDYSDVGKYEENMQGQYFPKDIRFSKGYSAFVDCGGFIGDTVEMLMKLTTPDRIVSFEPMIENYCRLVDTCSRYSHTKTEFTLLNNAISDKVKSVSFSSGTGSGSVSENGDRNITAVSLDTALCGFKPTFIKMDIEGEEINALNGARNMIASAKPDMAICVYHNIEHIWEIPLLISSFADGYSFYLRNYNPYTMETVLYAFEEVRNK